MGNEEGSNEKSEQFFFDTRAGAPTPVARQDPPTGWGDLARTVTDDADGYAIADALPGAVAIPDGTEGRLTLRLSQPGHYNVTLGTGEYHLVFQLHADGCEVSLGYRPDAGPALIGASFGLDSVAPIFRNAQQSGLTHLEFSGTPQRNKPWWKATLRPGLALLARSASLWLSRTWLTLEDLPDVGGGPADEPTPTLLTGEAELVLAFSSAKVPAVQTIQRVRVTRSGWPVAGLEADIGHLHIAAGARYSVPSGRTVRTCAIHQLSQLRIAPCSVVSEAMATTDPRNRHLPLEANPPVIDLPARSDRYAGFVGTLNGPAIVALDATRPSGAMDWRPGDLWIGTRADRVRFKVTGSHYTSAQPPTVRFMPSAYGRDNTFEVATDDRGSRQVPMRVGLHMAERSGLYETRGEVILRQGSDATIEGARDDGLLVVDLVPPELEPFDEPDPVEHSRPVSATEQPELLRGLRATDIRIDLASDVAPRLLQELRVAEVFDAHPTVWSSTGRPLGLPALDRQETSIRDELWLTPWTDRHRPSHRSRQHDLSLELLGEVTRDRCRSGTVRSGVARATLVRRQQRTHYWPEHALLLAGRPLGYGYLILRALLIWVLVSFVVAALAMAERGLDPSCLGLGRLLEGGLNVAVEPLGILRGVRAETWLESQVGPDRRYLATVGRAVVALPLVSSVVAMARRARSGPRRSQ